MKRAILGVALAAAALAGSAAALAQTAAAPAAEAPGLLALAAALDAAPRMVASWSGRKVAARMSVYLGRPIDPKLGLDYRA